MWSRWGAWRLEVPPASSQLKAGTGPPGRPVCAALVWRVVFRLTVENRVIKRYKVTL
jgi:hypothetical protein